jgi:hypothetical protein
MDVIHSDQGSPRSPAERGSCYFAGEGVPDQ